jgi:peptidoglycan/LPS O-acetylase OafA/YrhL
VLRIYPGYLVAYAVCGLLIAPIVAGRPVAYFRTIYPFRMLIDALSLDDDWLPRVFTDQHLTSLNGALWTIHYEFVCYLFIAALGLIGALRRRWIALLAFAGVYGCYAAQVHLGIELSTFKGSWLLGNFRIWPRLGSAFLAGSMFHLYRDKVRYTSAGAAIAAITLAALARLPGLWSFALAVPVIGGYRFFWVGLLSLPRLRALTNRADLSYGVYLYGWPAQQSLVRVLGNGLYPLAHFSMAALLAAFCATLSWFLVERPALRYKGRQAPAACPDRRSRAQDEVPGSDPIAARFASPSA